MSWWRKDSRSQGISSHVIDPVPPGIFQPQTPGPWFNIKMSSYQYRKSHCGDKTVVRSSYLHNGISYTGKMSSLYWIGAQGLFSLSGRTFNRMISWSPKVPRLGVIMITSLWNLTGISAALLPRCLPKATGKIQTWISQLEDFAVRHPSTKWIEDLNGKSPPPPPTYSIVVKEN